MDTENMRIWDAVQKTDPRHTKLVEMGQRKFTSIDAHYQVMLATKTFGPVGQGWGYDVLHSIVSAGTVILAAADVSIWFTSRENCYGPIRGMAELLSAKGRIDDDAAKKATTDALTKGLSHLGFNADVFLGRFDDNKYVAALKADIAKEEAPVITEEAKAKAADFRTAIASASTEPQLVDIGKSLAKSGLDESLRNSLRELYSVKHAEFKTSKAA